MSAAPEGPATECPECKTKGYLFLPSRGNCQTCLRMRSEYLRKAGFSNDAATEQSK